MRRLYSFSHASASRKKTSSVLVKIQRGRHVGFGEGCPRKYVTGETVEGAVEWIRRIRKSISSIATIDALKEWVLSNESIIFKNPSAWCAVETALIDLIGKERGRTVNELFETPATLSTQKVTAVISDGTIEFVESLMVKCLKFGFTDFKIKLTGMVEKDCVKTRLLRKYLTEECSVRVDFNNAFSSTDIDGFVRYLHKLNYRFSAIEEPFEPFAVCAMQQVAAKIDVPIILDESFLTFSDIEGLDGNDRFIPNIRISKLGGAGKYPAICRADTSKRNSHHPGLVGG